MTRPFPVSFTIVIEAVEGMEAKKYRGQKKNIDRGPCLFIIRSKEVRKYLRKIIITIHNNDNTSSLHLFLCAGVGEYSTVENFPSLPFPMSATDAQTQVCILYTQ